MVGLHDWEEIKRQSRLEEHALERKRERARIYARLARQMSAKMGRLTRMMTPETERYPISYTRMEGMRQVYRELAEQFRVLAKEEGGH